MGMKNKWAVFGAVSVLVVVLDQITKWWVIQNIELWRGKIEVIPGFFQLVHYQNTGAAFGALNDYDKAMHIFLAFTVVALGMMAWMVWKLPEKGSAWVPTMIGLITGGAIGNAIDRARMQAVTDFLRFMLDFWPSAARWAHQSFGMSEWPSFNVADMAIVVGIGAFFVQQLFQDDSTEEQALKEEDLPEKISTT
jgi:signal peptidase II